MKSNIRREVMNVLKSLKKYEVTITWAFLQCQYSGFALSVYRTEAAERLFPQEKAAFHDSSDVNHVK